MKDDIIRMAREAGILPDEDGSHYWISHDSELQCFAALVADAEAKRMHDEGMVTVGHMRQQIAAEREVCAAVARQWDVDHPASNYGGCIANLIEARGQA
jgi:hypothetical protein